MSFGSSFRVRNEIPEISYQKFLKKGLRAYYKKQQDSFTYEGKVFTIDATSTSRIRLGSLSVIFVDTNANSIPGVEVEQPVNFQDRSQNFKTLFQRITTSRTELKIFNSNSKLSENGVFDRGQSSKYKLSNFDDKVDITLGNADIIAAGGNDIINIDPLGTFDSDNLDRIAFAKINAGNGDDLVVVRNGFDGEYDVTLGRGRDKITGSTFKFSFGFEIEGVNDEVKVRDFNVRKDTFELTGFGETAGFDRNTAFWKYFPDEDVLRFSNGISFDGIQSPDKFENLILLGNAQLIEVQA